MLNGVKTCVIRRSAWKINNSLICLVAYVRVLFCSKIFRANKLEKNPFFKTIGKTLCNIFGVLCPGCYEEPGGHLVSDTKEWACPEEVWERWSSIADTAEWCGCWRVRSKR